MLFGRERAGKFARFADFSVESAEEIMKAYSIDCDYNRSTTRRGMPKKGSA